MGSTHQWVYLFLYVCHYGWWRHKLYCFSIFVFLIIPHQFFLFLDTWHPMIHFYSHYLTYSRTYCTGVNTNIFTPRSIYLSINVYECLKSLFKRYQWVRIFKPWSHLSTSIWKVVPVCLFIKTLKMFTVFKTKNFLNFLRLKIHTYF